MPDIPVDPIPLPPLDPALSASQLLDSLSGEQLGAALSERVCRWRRFVISSRRTPTISNGIDAVRRLRECSGDDPAELRVNLLELREQLAKIAATDEELASCIR